MKWVRLFFRMLRYPMPFILLVPLLIGAAINGRIGPLTLNHLWAVLALVSCYVVATAVNDIADRDIDAVNVPESKERPLLSGQATAVDLWIVQTVAMLMSLGFGLLIGTEALLLVLLALAIDYAYSLPPLRLSRFPILAPIVLSVFYVLIPYKLGTIVAAPKGWFNPDEIDLRMTSYFMAPVLMLLCFSRVLLKDFRDRKGDAAFGKTTFLLRFGKGATCLTSALAVVIGGAVLITRLKFDFAVEMGLGLYLGMILIAIDAIWLANDAKDEKIAISVTARLSTGVGIAVLGLFILHGVFATSLALITFTWGLFILLALRHSSSIATVLRLVFVRKKPV